MGDSAACAIKAMGLQPGFTIFKYADLEKMIPTGAWEGGGGRGVFCGRPDDGTRRGVWRAPRPGHLKTCGDGAGECGACSSFFPQGEERWQWAEPISYLDSSQRGMRTGAFPRGCAPPGDSAFPRSPSPAATSFIPPQHLTVRLPVPSPSPLGVSSAAAARRTCTRASSPMAPRRAFAILRLYSGVASPSPSMFVREWAGGGGGEKLAAVMGGALVRRAPPSSPASVSVFSLHLPCRRSEALPSPSLPSVARPPSRCDSGLRPLFPAPPPPFARWPSSACG